MRRDLASLLPELGHDVIDRGPESEGTLEYPPICEDLCRHVLDGRAERAIMVGGTGSGEHIACNKLPGIRAGLCHRGYTARISRANNDSNVLILGAKIVAVDLAREIVRIWLDTDFTGGRHVRRLEQIAVLEQGGTLL
jgi:ribose 5-phosphate isomerase B